MNCPECGAEMIKDGQAYRCEYCSKSTKTEAEEYVESMQGYMEKGRALQKKQEKFNLWLVLIVMVIVAAVVLYVNFK